jgi:hypothetical protein
MLSLIFHLYTAVTSTSIDSRAISILNLCILIIINTEIYNPSGLLLHYRARDTLTKHRLIGKKEIKRTPLGTYKYAAACV